MSMASPVRLARALIWTGVVAGLTACGGPQVVSAQQQLDTPMTPQVVTPAGPSPEELTRQVPTLRPLPGAKPVRPAGYQAAAAAADPDPAPIIAEPPAPPPAPAPPPSDEDTLE